MATLMMIARLLFVSLCVCAAAAQQVTQALQNCRANHEAQFGQCFMSVVKRIQPLLGDGFAELNLPPLEPILLDNIAFSESFPPVTIDVTFRNVKLYGFTTFDLKYLNLDFSSSRKQSLGLTISSLTAKGQYKIGGNVFLLPIEGDGDVAAVLDGIVAEGNGDIVREKGKVFLRNIKIGFKVRTMKIKMENLFQGNQVLSDTIHHFINANSELVMDAIRPGVTTQLNDFLGLVFNSMFAVLPPDVLAEIPNNQQGRVQRRPSLTENPSDQQGSVQRRPSLTETPNNQQGRVQRRPSLTENPGDQQGSVQRRPSLTGNPSDQQGSVQRRPSLTGNPSNQQESVQRRPSLTEIPSNQQRSVQRRPS